MQTLAPICLDDQSELHSRLESEGMELGEMNNGSRNFRGINRLVGHPILEATLEALNRNLIKISCVSVFPISLELLN